MRGQDGHRHTRRDADLPADPVEGVVARLGGDEFAVLLTSVSASELLEVADRLHAVLGTPVRLDAGGTEVAVTAVGSVGVATAASSVDPSGRGVSGVELLRRADVAMYRAKNTRGGIAHYDTSSDPTSLQRLLLEPELHAAFDDPEQILVEFQPQVDLSTGAPVGAEALVRWRHPVYGILAPDVVMPAVERCGLDRLLTLTVLDRGLAARAWWADKYGVDIRIAVNLSPGPCSTVRCRRRRTTSSAGIAPIRRGWCSRYRRPSR